ncbi:hypothetical protein G5714_002911 [Onychostoma macrolepis]|uniref:Uncharacterized protein n=1 Tax=Onychostoma macrolepis TaxID=369639 RepID=A0A7J6D8D8_9TELE|nr:hypothetical protein G5714_002911 [Onychostoma macrolepis]
MEDRHRDAMGSQVQLSNPPIPDRDRNTPEDRLEDQHMEDIYGVTGIQQHFAPEDTCTSASGRTRIKKGAVPSRFSWNDWGKGRGSHARQSVYQRSRKHFRAAVLDESQEMPVPGDITEEALSAGGVAKDHDYAYHPSPGNWIVLRRIQELELQVLSLELEIQQLTVKQLKPLIFKFCVTDEDFRYYEVQLKGGLHCVLGVSLPLCFKAFVLVQGTANRS